MKSRVLERSGDRPVEFEFEFECTWLVSSTPTFPERAAVIMAPIASYAFEELNHSLTALSTIPVAIPATLIADDQPASPLTHVIKAALRDLSTSKPITRAKLQSVLQTIADAQSSDVSASATYNAVDKVMEAEIMARAVTVLWRETLDTVVEGALALERDRVWWEAIVGSRFDVSLYFIQCVYRRAFPSSC